MPESREPVSSYVGPDRLDQMLTLQLQLQCDAYGQTFTHLTREQRIEYVRSMVLAATSELHEALNEIGWKPWATSKHFNEDAYFGELVDLWHFVMNLMLATGRAPHELSTTLYRGYMDKRVKNIQRQAAGYDGIAGKCPACKRALDDAAVNCWAPAVGDTLGWCDDVKVKVHISTY